MTTETVVTASGIALEQGDLTGGEALAGQLEREGIRQIFGVPGVQLDHAMDGLARLDGRVAFWNVRHEQAAAYMSDGYARATGDVGTAMVVPGPGLLNASAGLATAYACSSRVLLICGQLPSTGIGKGLGFLHEIPDQSKILASLTKWSARAESAAEIPGLVRRAVHELRSGRPRPVGIEIPPDVLSAVAPMSFEPVPERGSDGSPVEPGSDAIGRAVALIRASSAPVIYVGGGVLAGGAGQAVQMLAERVGAPVVMTRNGRGALSDEHPLAIGPLGAPSLLAASDLVLVVGSRFSGNGRSPALPPGARVVLVNADPADLRDPVPGTVSVLGDARLSVEAITAELGLGQPEASRVGEVAAVREATANQVAALEPQMSYVRALRDAIPADGFLVSELTQVGYVANIAYPVFEPGTFITPGYQGTLGYGFPAALGVKAACPDRAVVSINGDGGFGWSLQELATARRYDLGVAVVVFNDGAFGNVRRTQAEDFDGRYLGTSLTNPDFVKLADAFGIAGERVTSADGLAGALKQAVAGSEPVLIEVPIGEVPNPWALIRPGQLNAPRGR